MILIRKKLFVCIIIISITFSLNAQVNHRAKWLKEAKWGVMCHYLADWKSHEYNEEMTVEKWNEMINNFDVEGLANQLKSIGAGYFIFTIGQNSGYYLSPNTTYDKYVVIKPSKCSKRDLVSDLADALNERGIKLIVYLPSGAPAGDSIARNALKWKNGPYRNKEFQIMWEEIIKEWSLRWGEKISGWWFDGCYWPNTMYRTEDTPNFKSFAEAAKSGNPESIVAFNPGVVYRSISITPYEDYIAGEVDLPERISIRRVYDGLVDGAQLHYLSYLGERWGMGSPRFSVNDIIQWTNMVINEGGAFTWDVPIQRNGLISEQFLEQLRAIGKFVSKK